MTVQPVIWLASRSPRRSLLLKEGGIEVQTRPSDLDDSDLIPGPVDPESWVMALAYFKAKRVVDNHVPEARPGDLVLGADTLCVHDNTILGQPRDEDDAKRMIKCMVDATHRTLTGVCLLEVHTCRRMLAWDASIVKMGHLGVKAIDSYLASGQWRGKAGAYNLIERIEAGWPIECRGDPTTVMGLPMEKLPGWLHRFGFAR